MYRLQIPRVPHWASKNPGHRMHVCRYTRKSTIANYPPAKRPSSLWRQQGFSAAMRQAPIGLWTTTKIPDYQQVHGIPIEFLIPSKLYIETPLERELAAAEPSNSAIKRAVHRLVRLLDEYLIEPLLTFRRFIHIVVIFVPVLLTAPAVLMGRYVTDEDERKGALWWYDLLARQMERAGPTFIKLAQWIASRTDLFPQALCKRFSRLHSHVDPHPFSHTCHVLRRAFGRDLNEVFSEIDEIPLGVGAIAQVYKAKVRPHIILRYMRDQFLVRDNIITPDCVQTLDFDGTPINIHTAVAIKILHPKARHIIFRDLKIMSFFAKALTIIPNMHWISLPEEVNVFGEMMRDQLDLRIEANNLKRFNDIFADDDRVNFPRPVLAFTTKDMLLEEYVNGIPLNVFLEQASHERERGESGIYDHKIASIGLNAFLASLEYNDNDPGLHMLIFYNFVHADLHPGNIMVQLYKPSAHHPLQLAWSRLMGRYLKDDGDVAIQRVLAVHNDPDEIRRELNALADEGYSPRLMFIDAGLVNELNDVNRRNFLDLFQAIAQFDGYKAGELMVERCRTPELVVDPEVFALRMQHLILNLKQRTFKLGAVKIGNLLHNAMNMVRSHHVKLEGDFVNVVVSAMLLEGIGRQLNPDLDLFKSALPVLREYSIKDHGKATIESMKDAQIRGSAPHWIKVWIVLELRNWFLRREREDDWLQMCDFLCFNN